MKSWVGAFVRFFVPLQQILSRSEMERLNQPKALTFAIEMR
jgi:hypothetical protein